jgi:hypothetical protein
MPYAVCRAVHVRRARLIGHCRSGVKKKKARSSLGLTERRALHCTPGGPPAARCANARTPAGELEFHTEARAEASSMQPAALVRSARGLGAGRPRSIFLFLHAAIGSCLAGYAASAA